MVWYEEKTCPGSHEGNPVNKQNPGKMNEYNTDPGKILMSFHIYWDDQKYDVIIYDTRFFHKKYFGPR